jgi:ankyrin repeat protein
MTIMAAYRSPKIPLEIILLIADYLRPSDLLNLVQGIPHITTLLNSRHIQAQDENKHTILHMILEQGLEYLIGPLAKWIPQSSISDNEGGSLLHQAARKGDQRMAKALIHAG